MFSLRFHLSQDYYHDFKIHLPGAGDGIASKPYPFTVGDSCGMSSFPSGPTLPCLNWREHTIDQRHNSLINSLIQLRNRLSCRDKHTALFFGLFFHHIPQIYLGIEGCSLLNLALVESFAERVYSKASVLVNDLSWLLK